MNCPNCNSFIKQGSICPKCGVDAFLSRKTVQLSNSLYNRGLAEANMRDLSSAIESLSKSVSYNKKNTNARNLLGLVYFECGRAADALKQWIISIAFDSEENIAQKYIDDIQANTKILEKLGESINCYNQGLMYVNQKSEDMAVIQLKRAIDLNPNFIDALNLLALCYLILKDNTRAATCIEKVLSMDVNNKNAVNYYQEIYPGKSRAEAMKKDAKTTNTTTQQSRRNVPYIYAKPKKSFKIAFYIASALLFIIGVACTFAYFSVLVLPQTINEKDSIITQLTQEKADMEKNYTETISLKDADIYQLQDTVNLLNQENAELYDLALRQEKIQNINTADDLQKENKLEEAAEILASIDPTGLPEETIAKYDNMIATVYPKLAQNLYNASVTHYNRREYDNAVEKLQKALMYLPVESNIIDDVYYYLGLTFEMLVDVPTAIQYYEQVIDNYPNSNVRNVANNRLKRLQ